MCNVFSFSFRILFICDFLFFPLVILTVLSNKQLWVFLVIYIVSLFFILLVSVFKDLNSLEISLSFVSALKVYGSKKVSLCLEADETLT